MTNDDDDKPVICFRPQRIFRCRDRMCGGDDCATCYPEIAFRREDDEDEEGDE